MESAHATREDGRRHRADGERSRQAILAAAAELATIEGLDGLSIGRLAEHVGMSKSGVFAHFRSKEELQLATVDAAREIYDREVSEPASQAPDGLPRLEAALEAFLVHLERRVFPAGCFFLSAASELEVKHGPVRDHLRAHYAELLDGFAETVRQAQERGELDPEADTQQIVFELDSFLIGANIALFFFGDESATDRARAALRSTIERLKSAQPA